MMTIKDSTCDVCNIEPMIGVASTSIPYSCAYCAKCLHRGAQPEIVFEYYYEEVGSDCSKLRDGVADGMVTFKDGTYVSYRDWSRAKDQAAEAVGARGFR